MSALNRSGWLSLCVTIVSRATLAVLTSLVLASLVPAAFGWHPTVVMTGSMAPRLGTGDVVVSRPVATGTLSIGQVLLVEDPDHPGKLRLHRYVRTAADGRLILRGDANAHEDSSPVARSAVRGVASLRAPFIGTPMVWLQQGRIGALGVAGILMLLLVRFALWFRPAVSPVASPAEEPVASPVASPAEEPVAEPVAHPVSPQRTLVAAGSAPRTPAIKRFGIALAVITVLAVVSATSAQAALNLTSRTSNPTNTWAANQYFKCGGAEVGDGATFAWPLLEASGTLANDITANNIDGTFAGGVTRAVAGPCPRDATPAVTLDGTSGTITSAVTASNIPNIGLEIWFKSSGAHGGPLMSISGTTTTTMAMGVTSTGTVSLAIAASGTKSVTTTAAFNDSKWHLAVGVIGASGMALYVDNNAPVTSSAVTTAVSATGTPRVGFGNAASLGLGSFNYFAGSVAYAAGYQLSLNATQAATHYNAGT